MDKEQQLLEGTCGIRSSELKRKFQDKLAYHAYLTSPAFFKEIQVSTNIRVAYFPLELCSKVRTIENFATAHRSSNVLST